MLFQFLYTVMYAVTKRGRLKLLLDGYMYTKQREGHDHFVWRCCVRETCAARIWLRKLPSEKIIKQIPHSHLPDWLKWHRATQTAVRLAQLVSPSPTNSTSDIVTQK
jgi:hypothetical protein